MPVLDLLLSKELEKFKANTDVQLLVSSIIRDLHTTEVLKFLRLKGRCVMHFSNNPIESAALNGAHSSGYQECLDDLENFVEYFITEKINTPSVKLPLADFGGLKAMLERGDITKEEYDKRINTK